jgi:hypothetical protein
VSRPTSITCERTSGVNTRRAPTRAAGTRPRTARNTRVKPATIVSVCANRTIVGLPTPAVSKTSHSFSMRGARQSVKSPHGLVTEYSISESAFM